MSLCSHRQLEHIQLCMWLESVRSLRVRVCVDSEQLESFVRTCRGSFLQPAGQQTRKPPGVKYIMCQCHMHTHDGHASKSCVCVCKCVCGQASTLCVDNCVCLWCAYYTYCPSVAEADKYYRTTIYSLAHMESNVNKLPHMFAHIARAQQTRARTQFRP